MSSLADDLLVLARADQGRLPLQPEAIAARELLEAAAHRAEAACARAGRSIAVPDDGAEPVLIIADSNRVAQALDNLIANSLVYGAGAIVLAGVAAGEMVELHVLDRGAGFSGEFIDRAFDRFTRDAGGQGTGLGLAIVAAVARAHGGGAGARNRPDGGADVWLTLPQAQSGDRSR